MQWKAKLAAVAFGAALLAGITIPAASASTAPARGYSSPTKIGANISDPHLCNLTSTGAIYMGVP